MSLGYALVHPHRIENALESLPHKLGFDDATDVLLASLDLENPGEIVDALKTQAATEVRDLGASVAALFSADGPLGFFAALLDEARGGALKISDTVGKLADLLIDLDPARLHVHLGDRLRAVLDRIPLLRGADILVKLKDLLFAMLAVYERPFLAGSDTRKAVRGYRAAAFVRNLLAGALDNLLGFLNNIDVGALLAGQVDVLLAGIDARILRQASAIGTFIKTRLLDLVTGIEQISAGFSVVVSVNAGGPSPMPEPDPTYLDDHKPCPFPTGHWLWALDLGGSCAAFVLTFLDWWRVGWFHRGTDAAAYIINILWQGTRTITRAFRPSEINDNWFGKFMFSEWGDFSVQILLAFIGALQDLPDWDNYFLGVGNKIMKYVNLVVQPRLPYLVLRSFWYFLGWRDASGAADRPQLSRVRVLWMVMSVPWVFALIFGISLPWKDFDILEMQGDLIGRIVAEIIIAVLAVVGIIIWMGGFDARGRFDHDVFTTIMLWVATGVVAVVGIVSMMGLASSREPGGIASSTEDVVGWFFLMILGPPLLTLLTPIIAEVSPGEVSAGFHDGVFLLVAAAIGSVFSGVAMTIVWAWIVSDGVDTQGAFAGMDAGTSPYLLPYAPGNAWLVGQGFHGMFSHTYDSFKKATGDNHFAYDFNNTLDTPALAARGGLVVATEQDQPTNSTVAPNLVEIMHLDWVAGHDRGTDDERILSFSRNLHLDFQRVLVHLSQRVRQGLHIADIDCTGVSAQKHLHFQTHNYQQAGTRYTQPVLFRDDDTRWIRPFYHTDGKPMSFRFYSSDNHETPALPRPLWLWTTPAPAPDNHQHLVQVSVADLGDLSAQVTVRTGLANGHYHVLQIPVADLVPLLSRQSPAATTITSPALDGHTHMLLREEIDSQPPTAGPVTVGVSAPPAAQLLARAAGPYDVVGETLVLRVNDRATEFYPFGLARPRLEADLAIDVAPASEVTSDVEIAGVASTSADFGNGARSPVDALAGLNRGDASPVPRVYRLDPVLVFETVRTGPGASLAISPADQALLGRDGGPAAPVTGSGLQLDQVDPVALAAALQTALAGPRTAPAGLAVSFDAVTNQMRAEMGGAPVNFGGSTPRIATVLGAMYDSATTHELRLPGELPIGRGTISLQGAGGTFDAPIAALPASISPPFGDAVWNAAITADPLLLTVNGQAAPQLIRFHDGDTGNAALIADRILSQAEGVRAFVNATGGFTVETVSTGNNASLLIAKGAFVSGVAPNVGSSLTLVRVIGGNLVGDTALVTQQELVDAVNEAYAHATAPVAAGATVTFVGGKLTINAPGSTIAVGAPLSVTEIFGPAPPVAADTVQFPTAVTSVPIALSQLGWIMVSLTSGAATERYRIVLAGEPARFDLPVTELPAAGNITVQVNGAPQVVPIGGAASLADLVFQLNHNLTGVRVRIAARYVLEPALHGTSVTPTVAAPSTFVVSLPGSSGQAGAGFIHATPTTTSQGRGTYRDLASLGAPPPPPPDLFPPIPPPAVVDLAFPTTRLIGALASAYQTTIDGAGRVQLTAAAGTTLTITDEDNLSLPFAFAPGATANVLLSPAFAPSLPLGRDSVGLKVRATPATGPAVETHLELNACPAHLLATAPLFANGPATGTPAPPPNPLKITVTAPAGAVQVLQIDLAPARNAGELLALLERQAPVLRWWRVDTVAGRLLRVETRGGGTGWKLRLENPLALAVLGFDPASYTITAAGNAAAPDVGFIETSGRGNVADGARVTNAEVRDAFLAADAVATTNGGSTNATAEQSNPDTVLASEPYLAYQYYGAGAGVGVTLGPLNTAAPPPPTGVAAFQRLIQQTTRLRFYSQIDGCASAVIPLVKPRAFRFDRSLQRAPAVRASVALPSFGPGTKHLAGDLVIRIDDNSPEPLSGNTPAAVSITVHFDEADYTAAAVAAKIHAAFVVAGSRRGSAAAFDDGVIVVETATPGLWGTVEVPSAQAGDVSSGPLVTALGLDAANPLRARGWPGAGTAGKKANDPGAASLPDGLRSKVVGTPVVGTVLDFNFNGAIPPSYTVLLGATAASVADDLDNKFKGAGGAARVGVCKLGLDGAIYIESLNGALTPTINGAAASLAPLDPDHVWERGADWAPEPAFDLRQTNTLRTYRLVYDGAGDASEAGLVDLKWIRPPTKAALAPAPVGLVAPVTLWPNGGFLLAARAEGAKPDNYTAAGEMIIKSGTFDADGETWAIVHQARYWINTTSLRLLGLRKVGGEVLPYFVL